MKQTKSWQNELFLLLVGTVFTYALVTSMMIAGRVIVPETHLLVLALGFQTVFRLLFWNKYIKYLFWGCLLLLPIGFVAWVFTKGTDTPAVTAVLEFAWQMIAFFQNTGADYTMVRQILPWLATAGVSLYTAALIRPPGGFYLLTVGGLVVLGFPIYKRWGYSALAVVLLVLCILVLFVRNMQLHVTDKQQSVQAGKYSLLLLPLVCVVFGVAFLLPKPYVSTWYITPNGTLAVLQHTTPPNSQFAKRKTLGGPNQQPEYQIMEVQAEGQTYLRGQVFDTYENNNWALSDTQQRELLPNDMLLDIENSEPSDDMYQFYYAYQYGWLQQSVTITPRFSTKQLYIPPFGYETTFLHNSPNVVYTNASSMYWLPQNTKDYTAYRQSYIDYDTNGQLAKLLQTKSVLPYPKDDFLNRYLQVPEALPERVVTLAEELTADAPTGYDKLKALEEYLATYPYTLTPKEIPTGEDFIDYFLFTGKEGYCVYYATAMTVMARTQGIPTRYVEGYVLPNTADENGVYHVTSHQAHAWVEAYFPEFGWVRFEPTAPNNQNIYEAVPLPEPPTIPPDDIAEPQAQDNKALEANELVDPTEELLDPEQEETPIGRFAKPVIVIILLVIVLAGALYLCYWLLRYRVTVQKNTLQALPVEEAVPAYFDKIWQLTGILYRPITPQETIAEYALRMTPRAPSTLPLLPLAEVFEKVRYSKESVTEADKQLAQTAYKELVSLLEQQTKAKPLQWGIQYLRFYF